MRTRDARERSELRGRRALRAACWIAAATLIAVGCGGGGDAAGGGATEGSARAPVEVRTARAELREQPLTLVLDGTLVADEESQVTSVVPGRVVEVMVERGARVEEGAPLVRLRDVDFRLQARGARAQLEQARARLGMEGTAAAPPRPEETPDVRAALTDLELAEANLRRAEELAQRGVLAQQALDQTRAQAASARERYQTVLNGARASVAALEGARATLAQASTSASEATVRAPFSGEIADRMVSVGEYVAPQTPLVSLVRTDPLRIEVSVPQQHLLAVRPGQSVEVRVDAVPDRAFAGTVRYVSAAVRRETRGLTVEAVVPNPDGLLRPGLYATARIATGGTQEVAVVPSAAVLSRAGVDRVLVVEDGRVQERVVSIADRGEGFVVIEEGVRAGEPVVIGDLEQLADGMAVTVRSEVQASPEARAPEAG